MKRLFIALTAALLSFVPLAQSPFINSAIAAEKYSNLYASTLNGAINSSVTTVTVTSATGLPSLAAGDITRVIVGTEIMTVTAISGSDLTVTRGAESTTAASHSNGATITGVITAGALDALLLERNLVSQQPAEVSVTGAVTLTSTAYGKTHIATGTSANYAITLPTSPADGSVIGFRMSSALTKLVTLTRASSDTIDGANTRVMWAGETAFLKAITGGWTKIAGKSIPMVAVLRRNADQTGVAASTLTPVTLNATDKDNTGLMANLGGNAITIQRTGIYNVAGSLSFGAASGGLTATTTRAIGLVTNGSTFLGTAEQYGLATANPAANVTTFGVQLTAADSIQLKAFHNSSGAESVVGSASGSACLLSVVEVPSW